MFQAIFRVIRYELNQEGCVNDLGTVNRAERRFRSERTADKFADALGKRALAGRAPVTVEWDGPWHEGENKRDTLVFRRKRGGALLGEVRVLYGKGWDK